MSPHTMYVYSAIITVLSCFIITTSILLFMSLSFCRSGEVTLQCRDKKKLSCTVRLLDVPILLKWQFCGVCISWIYAIQLSLRQIIVFRPTSTICLLMGKTFPAFYTLSKICEFGFLTCRALLHFQAMEKWNSCINKQLVHMIIGLLVLGFVTHLVLVAIYGIGVVDAFGNCLVGGIFVADSVLLTVDFTASLCLFIIFIYPLSMTLKQLSEIASGNQKIILIKKQRLLKNFILGALMIFSSTTCLIAITVIEYYQSDFLLYIFQPLTALDVTISCILQFISTKRFWTQAASSKNRIQLSQPMLQNQHIPN